MNHEDNQINMYELNPLPDNFENMVSSE